MIQTRLVLALLLMCSLPSWAGPFDSARGTWTGAVQFNARHAPNAHSVGKFALFVQSDGAVEGEHANGCKMTGILKRYLSDNSYTVDVNIKGCAFNEYNKRWQGYLNVRPERKEASFKLSVSVIRPASPVLQYDIEGTLVK